MKLNVCYSIKMEHIVIIQKILRSTTPRFDFVVCSTQDSNNIATSTIDDIQRSLLLHKQRMQGTERMDIPWKSLMLRGLKERVKEEGVFKVL